MSCTKTRAPRHPSWPAPRRGVALEAPRHPIWRAAGIPSRLHGGMQSWREPCGPGSQRTCERARGRPRPGAQTRGRDCGARGAVAGATRVRNGECERTGRGCRVFHVKRRHCRGEVGGSGLPVTEDMARRRGSQAKVPGQRRVGGDGRVLGTHHKASVPSVRRDVGHAVVWLANRANTPPVCVTRSTWAANTLVFDTPRVVLGPASTNRVV